MKAFSELYTRIDETTKTNAKINALVNYFSTADEKDSIWCVAMLSGRRPKRTIKSGELKVWCMEIAQIPEWLFSESYSVVGDLSETITLMLPPPSYHQPILLNETVKLLKTMEQATDDEKKKFIQSTWQHLSTPERFIFNKLITGSFRIGVSQQLVVKALAKHYQLEENIVSHRLTGNWNPETTTLKKLLFSDNANDDHSKPYPFYLAYQLDQELETLGDIHEWQIERKFDGIRGQIIVRDSQLFVWSRGEDLVTEKFPEFSALIHLLPSGTVLDGEILPVKNNVPLPFHLM